MRYATTSRSIVEDVLGKEMTREIWSGNYEKALPISIQDFDVSAILPAVFYMFRFGQRRGKGRFLEEFGQGNGTPAEIRRSVTIERVTERLSGSQYFEEFQGEAGKAILGDLLLCFCLENAKKSEGRKEQIQRVAPTHYMSSWVDLPEKVADLRYVPETIVAMLAGQKGEYVQQSIDSEHTWFAVGHGFENNSLLRVFHQGINLKGELGNRASDFFAEETPLGIDQIIMIRLAQQLKSAPDKLRGSDGERLSNQYPIAEKSGRQFSEDIRRFIRRYAEVIPRQSLVLMLESCISLGLTNIITSSIEILFEWAETGEIRKPGDQDPTQFFIDCSNGVDKRLRLLAEQSFDDFIRRMERFPVILMALRLLDWGARYNPSIRRQRVETRPYATEWINLLGSILNDQHSETRSILYQLEEKSIILAEKLKVENPEVAIILENSAVNSDPVWRLAEALTLLQGKDNTQNKISGCLDSALMLDRPNGLALKRRIRQTTIITGNKSRIVKSRVLTDSSLEYLVHLHLLANGGREGLRDLSLKDFIHLLRDRYGLYIDEAPVGISISNEILQSNRAILERRLRDLGLLVGVNDAEAMKRLKPRFKPNGES